MHIGVNYFAVFLASVATMSLGFAWYSTALFGRQWIKGKGLSRQDIKKLHTGTNNLHVISFISTIITALVFSQIIVIVQDYYAYSNLTSGVLVGTFVWLGFIFPTQLTQTIYSTRNWQVLRIDAGYQLVSAILMGLILASF